MYYILKLRSSLYRTGNIGRNGWLENFVPLSLIIIYKVQSSRNAKISLGFLKRARTNGSFKSSILFTDIREAQFIKAQTLQNRLPLLPTSFPCSRLFPFIMTPSFARTSLSLILCARVCVSVFVCVWAVLTKTSH